MKSKTPTPSTRNYGIDALRLFAMFLVVILHVLGQGGVLKSSRGVQYKVSWLMEIAAYCATDCYALISGYVAYSDQEKPYRYSKYIPLWLQVEFYSFGITLITFFLNRELLESGQLVKSLLPVSTSKYWYFNAYTGLFFMIPWLNQLIRSCDEKQCKKLMVTITAVFICYGTASKYYSDPFRLGGGYSFIWLLLLYLIGAWLKKYRILDRIKRRYSVGALIGSILLTWLIKLYVPTDFGGRLLVSYTSPTIMCVAISWMNLFSKWKLSGIGVKVVKCFAPAAFGVYLIHVQSVIWENYMADRFVWVASLPAWLLPFAVIGCALSVFLPCLLIEKVRLLLFQLLSAFMDKIKKVSVNMKK
jgi:surface polysaccharide O-acyltransferase-like enzyme